MRGIPPSMAEDVASHSHSTTILTLLLAMQAAPDQNIERLLIMALIHDLPEAIIGDVPRSAQTAHPDLRGAKDAAEKSAMQHILAYLPGTHHELLTDIWKEYQEGTSLGAQLVEAADQLATIIHAAQLVNTGFSAELFSPFLDNAEDMLKKLQLPMVDELVEELRRILPRMSKE
jgi:putative hydrolase of HD superfamily